MDHFIQKSQMKFHISKLWSGLNDLGGTPWCFKTLKIISSRYPPFRFQPCRWNFGPHAQVECYNVSNFQNLILKVPNIFINVGVDPSWPHILHVHSVCSFLTFLSPCMYSLHIYFHYLLVFIPSHIFFIYKFELYFSSAQLSSHSCLTLRWAQSYLDLLIWNWCNLYSSSV